MGSAFLSQRNDRLQNVSKWVPPRLRPIIGSDLDAVDREAVERLIGMAEDTDLEFKQQAWEQNDKGRKECALDIADKANAEGALIVIGVTEEEHCASVLDPLTGLEPGELQLRVDQIVASRVSPPAVVHHKAVEVGNGSVHLLSIPPSTRSPHAVALDPGRLQFPVRSGTTRRMLSEPEVADLYWRRFDAARRRDSHLDSLHREGSLLVPNTTDDDEGWAWLVVAAVPEFPGRMELRREIVHSTEELINRTLRDLVIYDRNTRLHVSVGFQSLRIHDGLNPEDSVLYSTGGVLKLDGSGALVFGYWNDPGTSDSPPAHIAIDSNEVTVDLINAVGLLAGHATESGAAGHLHFSADLQSPATMVLAPQRPTPCDETKLPSTRPVPNRTGRSLRTALADDLVAPGVERVAFARLLALDLFSAFGLPEVPQITVNGEINLRQFEAAPGAKVEQWALASRVPIVGSPNGSTR
jgi:hypothetical protein